MKIVFDIEEVGRVLKKSKKLLEGGVVSLETGLKEVASGLRFPA